MTDSQEQQRQFQDSVFVSCVKCGEPMTGYTAAGAHFPDCPGLVDRLRAEVAAMRPVVEDYLRQAKNHKRHLDVGGVISESDRHMIRVADAYREASNG